MPGPGTRRTTGGMDPSSPLQRLPDRYAYALRMRHEGLDDDAIARILALEATAVRPFLAIAEAKVAELAGNRQHGHQPVDDEGTTQ